MREQSGAVRVREIRDGGEVAADEHVSTSSGMKGAASP
jgi:hypothetical protein